MDVRACRDLPVHALPEVERSAVGELAHQLPVLGS